MMIVVSNPISGYFWMVYTISDQVMRGYGFGFTSPRIDIGDQCGVSICIPTQKRRTWPSWPGGSHDRRLKTWFSGWWFQTWLLPSGNLT
jgi:hypothetical protein